MLRPYKPGVFSQDLVLDEESELYYYRARYFDPAVGTFVSEDPLGYSAGDLNVYRYVFNSPTNYTDPSGMIASGFNINRMMAI